MKTYLDGQDSETEPQFLPFIETRGKLCPLLLAPFLSQFCSAEKNDVWLRQNCSCGPVCAWFSGQVGSCALVNGFRFYKDYK